MQEDENPTILYQATTLQLLIENARDYAIIMLDTQGRIVFWNTGAENLLGWKEAEIIGQSTPLFFTPEDRAMGAPEQELRTAREEGRAENERWHVRKDGKRFWASGLAQPVYDANQTLQGYIQIFRDMTERRQAEDRLRESQERQQLALDASALGTFIWYVGEDRGEADAQTLAHFNLPVDNFISLRDALATLIHPDDRARYAQSVAQAIDPNGSGRLQEEMRVLYTDGSERWLAISGQTVFGNNPPRPLHINGITADITERKRREAHLAFLADLHKVFMSSSTVAEIQTTAGKRIADYFHVTHCLFVEVHQAEIAVVIHDQHTEGFPSLVGSYRLAEFHSEAERRMLAAGQPLVISNVRDSVRTPDAAERFEALGTCSLVSAPYLRDGQCKFLLSAQHAQPYQWRTDEAELLQELAERIYLRIERARAEESLRQHQSEIESLNVRLQRAMQETHHRVKNNLQVIAALVEMQADELGNGSAVQRIKQHVRSLATIHDLLTQRAKADTNTSVVNAHEVLQRLIPMLQATTGDRHIKAEVADVTLTVQKATSLALLVSECVSNAIKHAQGEVEITLDVEGDTAHLEVCDDGPGFPQGFDPRKAANTGLELIDSTARWDLRGEVVYENREQGGGRVVVTFPLEMSMQP